MGTWDRDGHVETLVRGSCCSPGNLDCSRAEVRPYGFQQTGGRFRAATNQQTALTIRCSLEEAANAKPIDMLEGLALRQHCSEIAD